MFVKSTLVRREKCYKIRPEETVRAGLELMEKHGIDALPVVSGTDYKGIITRHQAYRGFFNSGKDKEQYLDETAVNEILVNEDVYLHINDVYEKALVKLNSFPIIAVLDEGEFLGILTRYDVINQFQSAFGFDKRGIRITFTSAESEGRIAKLGQIIEKFHESVISLVTFDETDKLVRRIVLKVEKRENIERFLKELGKAGFRVLDITEA